MVDILVTENLFVTVYFIIIDLPSLHSKDAAIV